MNSGDLFEMQLKLHANDQLGIRGRSKVNGARSPQQPHCLNLCLMVTTVSCID